MAEDRDAWLKTAIEEAIDPGLPICDPHHHLWDYPNSRYLLDELLRDTGSGHNVVSTVFVECAAMYRQAGPVAMQPVGETEFVQGIAAQSASGQYGPTQVAAGIVGFADLGLGEAVAGVLEAHLAASRNRFRGVRHATAWDGSPDIRNAHTHPPAGFLGDAAFRRGFDVLQRMGLSFDAWLYYPQLPELAELARAFPEATIILDHVGGVLGIGPYAGRRDEIFEIWKRSMADLASCPNVVVKLGGLAMSMCGFGWHRLEQPPSSTELAAAMAPYYRYCIEQFGVHRCMFESNFPVDKVSCSYTLLWNAFKRITEDFSSDERAALFHDTAARIYRV
ncbi:amidohydrolase family protein [Candidatus Entotheonella palauensis]|uniref:amidohydrolase family protein n=1 Tax=Candidatus Entotheonella palauensis TaxID=93172 RepID=UPI000B7D36FE|nr:amidohydrolase family protein [Candidatus Entotheonella palauensis]